MTRIVAGSLRGRTLRVPPRGTRPTSERVREALFGTLEHRGALDEALVLDLYAGSGALGLEAVSRGAAHATLVDAAREAADVCRRNVRELGLSGRVSVVSERAERFVARPGGPGFGLVFLDPPYDLGDAALTQVLGAAVDHLAPQALVVVERSRRAQPPVWPAGLTQVDERTYGETRVWLADRDDERRVG